MSDELTAAIERFDEHLSCFDFKNDILQHSEHFSADIHNVVNLCSLENEPNISVNDSTLLDNDNITILDDNDVINDINSSCEN